MDDPLHLYPSLVSLLWLWGVGVFAQVIALMGWWMLPSRQSPPRALSGSVARLLWRFVVLGWPRSALRGRAGSQRHDVLALDRGGVACSPVTPSTAHSRLSSHRGENGARFQVERLEACVAMTQDVEEEDTRSRRRPRAAGRSFQWKRLALRSALATTLVAVASVTTSTVMLYMRTGRYTQQPYEWYSLAATGDRFFSDHLSLPRHLPDTCTFRNASGVQTRMTTLDEVIAKYQRASGAPPRQHTHVFVVPFFWDHVVELREDQVQPVRSAASRAPGDRDAAAAAISYERTRPVDEVTMFPYLWHSILGPHFDRRVTAASARGASPWSRRVDALNLEFEIVRSSAQLSALPRNSNVLLVTQSIYIVGNLLDMRPTPLPADARVGFLSLAREDCNNLGPDKYLGNVQLKFGFLPYGDCSLVDADRFSVVPLGPSFEHGFPTNAHAVAPPPVATKQFLLNLMVSWTVEKPTRIQAAMAALEVCAAKEQWSNSRRCVIEHNDMLFKALQAVDARVGSNLRWLLSSAPDTYLSTLRQSVFTLCPLGKNPEQYRIWEALAAGSIPIVEELPAAQSLPGSFFHPSYPMSWKCMPEDMHGVLKRLDAPVLFVSDWKRDLPRIMDEYVAVDAENPAAIAPTSKLLALHERVAHWYLRLGSHLQAQVIAKAMDKFSA